MKNDKRRIKRLRGQGEFTCDECGKKFRLSAEMKWEYTTENIDGEMTEEEHDDMDNFLG